MKKLKLNQRVVYLVYAAHCYQLVCIYTNRQGHVSERICYIPIRHLSRIKTVGVFGYAILLDLDVKTFDARAITLTRM